MQNTSANATRICKSTAKLHTYKILTHKLLADRKYISKQNLDSIIVKG